MSSLSARLISGFGLVILIISLGLPGSSLAASKAAQKGAAHRTPINTNPSRSAKVTPVRRTGKAASSQLTAATTVLKFANPPIQARAAFLLDVGTNQVLFQKNADAELPMASTTKITTAALVLAHSRLSDMVTVSKAAATIGESSMGLVKGERLTVLQLLYGLLLNSGNDAAIALAEHVGGSQVHFVAMMNALAASLGMTETHYVTPHGLDAPGHYTSARDLAMIALYAMQNSLFRKIVATESMVIPATKHNRVHWLNNINHVMYWYPGVDGVKPGDTDAAGLCQVVDDWRNGHHLLAVLLNTPNLWLDIRNLLNYGSRDFQWVQSPVWGDGPSGNIATGSADHGSIYYFGAGQYVRGAFLHYFRTHGGFTTMGYPRTGPLLVDGQKVQYFQAAELIKSPSGSVRPVPLGTQLAALFAPNDTSGPAQVIHGFLGIYRQFGGSTVLGSPISNKVLIRGHDGQLFQYGAIVQDGSNAKLVPLGDIALHELGWIPATGAANSYPPSIDSSLSSL